MRSLSAQEGEETCNRRRPGGRSADEAVALAADGGGGVLALATPEGMVRLQRTVGNRAVAGLLSGGVQRQVRTPARPTAVTFGRVGVAGVGGGPSRVPPTRSCNVPITIASLPSRGTITLDVEGSGGAAGEAIIANGSLRTSTGNVLVRGDVQTTPGNAGQLRLRAMLRGAVVARSQPFSVAAYPRDWRNSTKEDIDDPDAVGVAVDDRWSSDGGAAGQLDQVGISELVDLRSRDNPPFISGAGTSTTSGTSGYLPGTAFTSDRHSYGRAAIDVSGLPRASYTIVYTQLSIFRCRRTGVVDVPMPNSGYTITHSVWWDAGERRWKHRTVKAGAATAVGGHRTNAGAGGGTSRTHNL